MDMDRVALGPSLDADVIAEAVRKRLGTDVRVGNLSEYLTTEELAEKLRTTPATCRWWRHVGRGPRSFRVGKRVLYAREDVEAFIAEARQGAA